MLRSISFAYLICLSVSAFAYDANACFESAAARYKTDKLLLMAISKQESNFNPRAINVNDDKTKDIGLMQINTTHLPLLMKAGFKESELFDACTSIHIGAFILNDCVRRHGMNWRAVGCYNAGSRKNREGKRLAYVNKVRPIYESLKQKKKAGL